MNSGCRPGSGADPELSVPCRNVLAKPASEYWAAQARGKRLRL